MYEFLLMTQVAEHLRVAHRVTQATRALMSSLEVTCVTEVTSGPVR